MNAVVGSDHRGVAVKGIVTAVLKSAGFTVSDVGTLTETSVDYPDIARRACRLVQRGSASFGVLSCGTGIGIAIAANKCKRIRAALVRSVRDARYARLHNDANVLVIPGSFSNQKKIGQIVYAFMNTHFEGGRHTRRIQKISRLESGKR